MSKYGDENKMIMITPESLMTQYAERMACFSYCCKECIGPQSIRLGAQKLSPYSCRRVCLAQ